jgi:hypothetical protein
MNQTFTSLLDARCASAVQYRATVPQGHRVESVVMTAIGADTEPSGTALAAPVSAAAPTADDVVYLVWNGSSWSTDGVEHPTWNAGPLNGQLVISNLPAGHFTLYVRAVDAAGKHSALESNSTVLSVW